MAERYEYDAYGEVTIWDDTFTNTRAVSSFQNPYTFTGRRLDMLDPDGSGGYQLKLMDYRARTYDPQTGRFMQRDPLGIDPAEVVQNNFKPISQYKNGMNMYLYVYGNPIRLNDPMGMESCDIANDMLKELGKSIGEDIIEKIILTLGKEGLEAARDLFPNEQETLRIGPKTCKPGRIRYLKMRAILVNKLELKSEVIDMWPKGDDPLAVRNGQWVVYKKQTTINVYICRCPCSGNFGWNKTATSKISAASDWSLIDGIGIDKDRMIWEYSLRTVDEAKLDVFDCVWNVGPIIEWLCTK